MKKIFGITITVLLSLAISVIMLTSLSVLASELPIIEKTDRFNVIQTENGLNLISQDGELVIHIGDNTEIVFEDGTNARESLINGQTVASLLNNRNLTVSYSVTTRSIPAQTTPEKIVILYEIAVPLPVAIDNSAPIGIVPPIYEFSPGEIEEFFPLNR